MAQSNIGEDLLLAANDQPFRFPAEFTFVIRSFTVLDGIGKSLTPKFDISEISAPYARSLLLESNPALQRLQVRPCAAALRAPALHAMPPQRAHAPRPNLNGCISRGSAEGFPEARGEAEPRGGEPVQGPEPDRVRVRHHDENGERRAEDPRACPGG